jgi:acyl carrier protein
MLARLGEIAKERRLTRVEAKYIRTKKNQPAVDFLEGVGSKYKEPIENGLFFKLPTGYVEKIAYAPGDEKTIIPGDAGTEKASPTSGKGMVFDRKKLERLAHIAENLNGADLILKQIESQQSKQRPDLACEYIAPRTEIERAIAEIWQKALRIENIGINDDYIELGGTSLVALQILLKLRETFRAELTFGDFFASLTVRKLGELINNKANQANQRSEIILRSIKKIENMEESEIKKLLGEMKSA